MTHDEPNPGRLLELSGSYWESLAFHAGVTLDVFSIIGDRSLTGEEAAGELNADPRGTAMLLNALTALGILEHKDDRYTNTETARKFLVKTSPNYLGFIVRHHHDLVPAWHTLDESVRRGGPVKERAGMTDDQREAFLMGMFNIASTLAPRISRIIDLSGRRHLLDLGGGPGTYAIHFCLANPRLKGTIYDLPTTEPFALETIARFGVSDRVDFIGGDYTGEPIPGKYDVVWMSQTLHSEGPDTCRLFIEKAVDAMEKGGLVIIHEFILDDTMDKPLHPALFSLNMLVNTREGRSYSEAQIKDMLKSVGLKDVRRLEFDTHGHSGLIVGIV